MTAEPRKISKETFDHLDSLEKIVAQKWAVQGRWVIVDNNGGK